MHEKVMNPWRRGGPIGIAWGVVQGMLSLVANLVSVLPAVQGRFPLGSEILTVSIFLGVFGAGAVVGLLVDDPDVTMRAFPISQLIGFLSGWGLLSIAGPAYLGPLGDLEIIFIIGFAIVWFLLAGVGALVGSFLIGMYEGSMARSLDWRVLVASLVIGLTPAYLFSSSPDIGGLSTSHLEVDGMIGFIVVGSCIGLYGFFRGGQANARTFSLVILMASLTGLASFIPFTQAYSLYGDCVKPPEPPCTLAADLQTLTIVMGSTLFPFGIAFFGCLFAKDTRSLTVTEKPE
ncbi:MAG TPA: hypothetical protein VFE96_03900 [Candidatus Bathyarchaeia archaeon]|nr:hypothetical protein [Candidatus Bathyarchaeia archaeon]